MEKEAMDLILGATQSAGSGGGGGSDVPTPAAGDTGKVLTVGSNLQPAWDDVPKELPTPASGDAGKVLTVGSGQTMEWDDVPKELPSIASADKGKFLKVDNLGKPAWAAVPTELPSHTASDKDKMLSVNNSNNVVWKAVPTELPAHGSADADKVLTIASDGSLMWDNAGGGGGGSDLPEYDEGNAGDFLQVADDGSLWWTTPKVPAYDGNARFCDQSGQAIADDIYVEGVLKTENPGLGKPSFIGIDMAGTADEWQNDLTLQAGPPYQLTISNMPIIPKAIIVTDLTSGNVLFRIFPSPQQQGQAYIDVANWTTRYVKVKAQFVLQSSVTIAAGASLGFFLMM